MLINIKKSYAISFSILVFLTVGLIAVYAYGSNPGNPVVLGHTGNELDVKVSPSIGAIQGTMTLQNAIDNNYLGDRMLILKNQPLIDYSASGTPANVWYVPAALPGVIPLNAKFAVIDYEMQVSGLVSAVAGKTTCPSVQLEFSSNQPVAATPEVTAMMYDNGIGPALGGPLAGREEQIVVPLIPGTGKFSFKYIFGGPVNPNYPCTYAITLQGYVV